MSVRQSHLHRAQPRAGILQTIWKSIPYMLFGAVLGTLIYNPTGFSLYDGSVQILIFGLGDMENIPWYFQPAKIGVFLVVLVLVTYTWFNWEIARNELFYVIAFLVVVGVLNCGVIGFYMYLVGGEMPFTIRWVQWQLGPVIMAALVLGARVPKARIAYSGTRTVGGGALDEQSHAHEEEYGQQH